MTIEAGGTPINPTQLSELRSTLGIVAFSAGTALLTAGTMAFADSNGLTFGLDGSTITASVKTDYMTTGAASDHSHGNPSLVLTNLSGSTASNSGGLTISLSAAAPTPGAAISAAGSSQSNGTIVFANSNGLSFGMNGSTVTASHNAITTQSAQAVSAGNGSSAFQTLSMADGGGVSWSTVAGGLQATVKTDYLTTAAQSNHSHGNPTLVLTNLSGSTASNSAGLTLSLSAAAPVGGVALSAGTQSASSGTMVFANSNGMSFGMSGSSQITASYSVPSTAGLLSAIKVSAGASSGNVSSINFSNANGVSFGYDGTNITGSVAAVAGAQTGISGFGNSETTYTSGTVGLSALGAVTIRSTTGQQFQISVAPQSAQTQGVVAPSAGTQTATSGTVVFANSNGLTFGMSGSSQITGSYSVPGATVFSNSNNVSFGLNGSTVTATASFAQSAQLLGLYASSQTYGQSSSSGIDARSLSFVGSGGVTVGLSAGSILISGQTTAAQSVQTQSTVAVLGSTGAISFVNANGITFGGNASSITASHNGLTTARASNDAIGLNTAQTNVTWSVNSSGISLNAAGYAGTGTSVTGGVAVTLNSLGLQFNGANLAGTSTGFTGANVSASMTHNSAGLAISMSVAAPGAGGGIAQAAGTQTATSGTVIFANSNGISFGMSGSSQITASYSVPVQSNQQISVFAGSNTTQGTSGTFNASSLLFAGAGNVSVGISNGSIVISGSGGTGGGGGAGNVIQAGTTGTTGTTFSSAAGTVLLNGVGALTVSQNGSNQIVLSAPATSSLVGANGINVSTNGSTISILQGLASYVGNGLPYLMNSQTQTVQQSTSVVFPLQAAEQFSAGFVRMPHSISMASTSFASTANTSYSYNQQETHNAVLYSLGTGASSQSLMSFASSSFSVAMSVKVSQNTTNNISVTHGLTFPVSNGTSSLSFSYAATNASVQISITHMTALTGVKMWDSQFAASALVGRYWMGYGQSTAQTTQQTAALSGNRLLHSQVGMSQPNNTIGLFGVANAGSVQWQQGLGSFSSGAVAAAIDLSQISSSASHVVPYVQFINQA